MARGIEPKKLLVLGSKGRGTNTIYSLLQQILCDCHSGDVEFVYEPFQWSREKFNCQFDKIDRKQFEDSDSLSISGIYHHQKMPLICRSATGISDETRGWIQRLLTPTKSTSSLVVSSTRANGRAAAIGQVAPDAKIVAVFQNPLDVIDATIAEAKHAGDDFFSGDLNRLIQEMQGTDEPASIIDTPNRIEREFEVWKILNNELSKTCRAHGAAILPVVFEEFSTDPESITRKLCQFLDIESCEDFVLNTAKQLLEYSPSHQLTAHQYLSLENRLSEYQHLVEKFSDFDLDTSLRSIKTQFITGNFPEEPKHALRIAGTSESDTLSVEQLLAQVSELQAKLDEKELELCEQLTSQNRLLENLKRDMISQNGKLSHYDELLTELRKVQSYPATQIDRKYKAYRKLLKTYDAVKPQWHDKKHPGYSNTFLKRLKQTARQNGINLGNQLDVSFGNHRSGWSYAVSALKDLNNPDGIYLDTFIERTFCWSPEGVRPHTQPWIGFIHMPHFAPAWFKYEQTNHCIFETQAWKESQPNCLGLFTLSKYHRDHLQPKFDFPVENLIHPTEFPDQSLSWYEFESNPQKRIVQLGWWLRKLHAIYQLPASSYRKTLIKPANDRYLKHILEKEKKRLTANGEFDDSMYETVEQLSFLSDQQYDQLLSSNIAFLYLYDASANNSVIECIVRGTPLLVNRIPAVVEYLGEDYPMYYESQHQAVEKAMDFQLVKETHEYLMQCETRKKLTGEYFKQSLIESNLLLNAYQGMMEPKKIAA